MFFLGEYFIVDKIIVESKKLCVYLCVDLDVRRVVCFIILLCVSVYAKPGKL